MAQEVVDVASSEGWQKLLALLPEDFEDVAKECGVLEVQYGDARIKSARELLRLILLHAGADLGLRQTVTLVAEQGGPKVSHVTLHKKMRLAAPFLRALVAGMTDSARRPASVERWAGYDVVVVDGSTFCGPGATGTDARVHLQLRLSDLEIVDAIVEDQSVGESFKRFTWHEGQLALGDRGYANPPGLASVVKQGAEALVRVNRSSMPLFTLKNEPIVLLSWLRALRGYSAREMSVIVRGRDAEVTGRLVAMRLPAPLAEKARARLRRDLGNQATFADVEAAEYVVLFTTVPRSRMPTEMCVELYRVRWQIELAFKRWKSICHFDRLPNYRDDTILSWLYAKLLLALLVQRIATGASGTFPPEPEELNQTALACDALESRDHRLARSRRRVAAA